MYIEWRGSLPLRGPAHKVVADKHGRRPVEHLSAEASPSVEDRIVRGAGEGVLSVRAKTVGDNSLLGAGTWTTVTC